jgi:hypothetical protein
MSQGPRDPETDDTPEDTRIGTRAELLPEEQQAGSDDPEGQAAAILEDSDRRTADPSGTRAASSQTLGED